MASYRVNPLALFDQGKFVRQLQVYNSQKQNKFTIQIAPS